MRTVDCELEVLSRIEPISLTRDPWMAILFVSRSLHPSHWLLVTLWWKIRMESGVMRPASLMVLMMASIRL